MPQVRRVAAPAPAPAAARRPAGPPISAEINAAIAAAASTYSTAAPKGSSFIEDGDYQGEIVTAELAVSKQQRNLMAKFQIRVLNEGMEGAIVWKNSMLHSADNIGWFKGELERMGVTCPKDMRSVPAVLKSLEGTVVDFRAKTSADGQFQNYNILGVSEEGAPAEGDPAAGGEIIEEVPGEEVIEEVPGEEVAAEGEILEEVPEGEILEEIPEGEEIVEEAAPAPAPARRVATRPVAAKPVARPVAAAPAVRRVAVPAGVTRVVVRRPAAR